MMDREKYVPCALPVNEFEMNIWTTALSVALAMDPVRSDDVALRVADRVVSLVRGQEGRLQLIREAEEFRCRVIDIRKQIAEAGDDGAWELYSQLMKQLDTMRSESMGKEHLYEAYRRESRTTTEKVQ